MEAPFDMRPGRGLRIALLIGFGGLLCMLLIAGIEALATLKKLHSSEEAARHDFLVRNECLLEFRSTLDAYNSSIEQYFLTINPDLQSAAANDFVRLARRIHAGLATYPARRAHEEEELIDAVKQVLSQQESSLNKALSEDRRTDAEALSKLLYQDVMPRNRRLITATEQVELWNQRQLGNADTAMIDAFAGLQSHLTRLLFVVLGSGLILAIGSIVYIVRQDQEARRRYAELVATRDQLSRFPSSLLDAQEEERRSISRELHDEVGQSLSALLVDVGRLKTAVPADDPVAQEQIGRIKSTAESAVNAVRNIALLLRPSMLDDLGLIAAIEWQGREVSRRSEMEVEVDAAGVAEGLPEEYKICIYRVAQEALNNAARHSGAKRALVKLEQTAALIAVTVRDDGRGFDPGKTRGLGLLGMEERVRRLGGKLDITSQTGQGTILRAELPMGHA